MKITSCELIKFEFGTLKALSTEFLIPGLTRELGNPLDDWLD